MIYASLVPLPNTETSLDFGLHRQETLVRATRNQDVPYSTIKSSAQGQLETARLNFLLYVGEVRLINTSKNWTRILFQCQRHFQQLTIIEFGFRII